MIRKSRIFTTKKRIAKNPGNFVYIQATQHITPSFWRDFSKKIQTSFLACVISIIDYLRLGGLCLAFIGIHSLSEDIPSFQGKSTTVMTTDVMDCVTMDDNCTCKDAWKQEAFSHKYWWPKVAMFFSPKITLLMRIAPLGFCLAFFLSLLRLLQIFLFVSVWLCSSVVCDISKNISEKTRNNLFN